jgi:hypothetical protein
VFGVLAVGADGLPQGVDLPRHGGPGAREIDWGDGAPRVPKEAVEPSLLIDVAPHGLAGLVGTEGQSEGGGPRDVDGGDGAAGVAHEAMARDVGGGAGLAGSHDPVHR